jgi:excisionase family DNA binding protein
MNPQINQLFAEYLLDAKDPVAAAVLTLAHTLRREPIIVEPDDKGTVGVKEAAELLHTSSKKVYQMCLAGRLRCARISGRIRIGIDEIERCEEMPARRAGHGVCRLPHESLTEIADE